MGLYYISVLTEIEKEEKCDLRVILNKRKNHKKYQLPPKVNCKMSSMLLKDVTI